MKKLIITISALGLILSAAQGQQNGPGTPEDPAPNVSEGGPMHAGLPEEIVALRSEMKTLREELQSSREAVLDELGEDATQEEIIAALTLWKEDNAEAIDALQSLSEEIKALIHENRPGRPWEEVVIPEEILALRDQLKDQRSALNESRQEAIAALGEDPTDEEIRLAIEAWRVENADAIAEMKALSEQIRDWFRENRPNRPDPEFTPGMAGRSEAFQENRMAMKENRKAFSEQMRNPELDPEERQAIVNQFRDEHRELMQERKELMRQERVDQGGVGGDRRPGG